MFGCHCSKGQDSRIPVTRGKLCLKKNVVDATEVMSSSVAIPLMLAAVAAAAEGLTVVSTAPYRLLRPLQLQSRAIGTARGSPRKSSNWISRTCTRAAVMAAPLSTASSPASAPSSSKNGFTLESLPFDNAIIRELPIDAEPDNFVRKVPNACFSVVTPDPVDNPVFVAASNSALELLGVEPQQAEREDFAQYFSGEICCIAGKDTLAAGYSVARPARATHPII